VRAATEDKSTPEHHVNPRDRQRPLANGSSLARDGPDALGPLETPTVYFRRDLQLNASGSVQIGLAYSVRQGH
jgi:hypothetical protein